jgi:hypothetical protein
MREKYLASFQTEISAVSIEIQQLGKIENGISFADMRIVSFLSL